MSRGIIINNPGAVETVVNLTTIRALDGDTIYTGSVYLSDISEDEIDAVKSAIEAYSPTPGPGPTPPTPGPEIEPYYVPGWFDHQDGNWVLVKAGQTWEIRYSDDGSSWTDISYTASDEDTWFNMDNEAFRQAKYIRRKNTSSSGDNKILAMNLDMPNYISAMYISSSATRYTIFNDPSLNNVKIKIDHFEDKLRCMVYNNQQMTTCEIEMYNPDLMTMTDMSYMFYSCNSLQSLDLSNWNVENVTNMSNMFYSCNSLQSLDLSNWNVENVTNMSYMFAGCYSLQSLDLSNWNVSNATNMSNMFQYCYSLQSLDLSNWNVSNVTDMSYMFYSCNSLQSLDLSNWNVSNVTNMQYMFYNCYSLQSLDLSNWNVSNVTNMSNTFYSCASLQSLDLSNWNVSNVTNMSYMFTSCYSLKDFKIKSKPKTQALWFDSSIYVLSNDSLQWMADNFPDISGDDTYTNKTISGFSSLVKSHYMWNYFYNTMTAKGYTIS